jgi:hypothetical protein
VTSKLRVRFWIELGLSAASAVSLFLTIVWKEWIEMLTGLDPDNHSGSAEWMLAGLCALAMILFAVLSRYEWRRTSAAPA